MVSPGRWIQTVFAKAPIDVAFVGADGTILRTRRALKPGGPRRCAGRTRSSKAGRGSLRVRGSPVGDRVALREAQAPRPAREVAPWRSAVDEAEIRPARRPTASGIPTRSLTHGTSALWTHLRRRRHLRSTCTARKLRPLFLFARRSSEPQKPAQPVGSARGPAPVSAPEPKAPRRAAPSRGVRLRN